MFDPTLSQPRTVADTTRQNAPPASGGGQREKPMNVSPLDLRQQRFRNALRGYDKIEVTSFLMAVADDYEQALRDVDRLRTDLTRMEAVLNEHREHERGLKAALMAAQKLAEDITSRAEDEARRLIREAQERSDLILQKSQARLEDVQREIDGLKLKRRDVETSIEATIQTLRNTLEYVREQEARDREEKILLHRPRHSEAQSESAAKESDDAEAGWRPALNRVSGEGNQSR
jgi:cell division initiation protein